MAMLLVHVVGVNNRFVEVVSKHRTRQNTNEWFDTTERISLSKRFIETFALDTMDNH